MKSGTHWPKRFARDNAVYLKKLRAKELRKEVLEILISSDLTPMANLISLIFSRKNGEKENREREEKKKLYQHMAENYPGTLSLKLLHIFMRFVDQSLIRFWSLSLLHALLSRLRRDFKPLSSLFTEHLKQALLSSLLQENPGLLFKILSQIVSLVASEVFESEIGEWNSLRDFISTKIDDSEVEKGLMIFQELPLSTGCEFLSPVLGKIFPVITRQLGSREIKSWVLAFGAAFNFALLMIGSRGDEFPKHKRKLRGRMVNELAQSMTELVKNGNEDFVRTGVQNLALLVRDKAGSYSLIDCNFLEDFISKITEINGVGEMTKQAAARVLQALKDHSIVAQMCNLCDSEEENGESD